MPSWSLNCPVCQTKNEVLSTDLKVNCGMISCTCTCKNCKNNFSAEQPYWRWLGLEKAPPSREEDLQKGQN